MKHALLTIAALAVLAVVVLRSEQREGSAGVSASAVTSPGAADGPETEVALAELDDASAGWNSATLPQAPTLTRSEATGDVGRATVVLRIAGELDSVAHPAGVTLSPGGDGTGLHLIADVPLEVPLDGGSAASLHVDSMAWTIAPKMESVGTLELAAGETSEVFVESRHVLWVRATNARSGAPLDEFSVEVQTQHVEGCCPVRRSAVPVEGSGLAGAISIGGIDFPGGELRAAIRAPGFQPRWSEWVSTPGGLVALDVALEPLDPLRRELEVEVVDSEGAAVVGARVTALEDDPEAPLIFVRQGPDGIDFATSGETLRNWQSETQSTDAEGHAFLSVQAPARYRVYAIRPAEAEGAAAPAARLDALSEPILVASDAVIRLELGGTGVIEGTVEGSPGDWGAISELSGVVIDLGHGAVSASLGPDGRFRFENLAAGGYTLELKGRSETGFGGGVAQSVVLASLEVEVDAVSTRTVRFTPDDLSASIEVRVPALEASANLTWMVVGIGIDEGADAPTLLSQETVEGGGRVRLNTGSAGRVTTAALGLSEHRRVAAFAFGPESMAPGDRVSLDCIGAPVEIRNRSAVNRSIRLRALDVEGIRALLVHDTPTLSVGAGESAWIHGLPEGRIELDVDGTVYEAVQGEAVVVQ